MNQEHQYEHQDQVVDAEHIRQDDYVDEAESVIEDAAEEAVAQSSGMLVRLKDKFTGLVTSPTFPSKVIIGGALAGIYYVAGLVGLLMVLLTFALAYGVVSHFLVCVQQNVARSMAEGLSWE